MVTSNPADALGWGDRFGRLAIANVPIPQPTRSRTTRPTLVRSSGAVSTGALEGLADYFRSQAERGRRPELPVPMTSVRAGEDVGR